jgi:hypothetical protein
MIQGGDGARVQGTATPGGTITVNVGSNEPSVEVNEAGSTGSTSIPVEPNKDTPIPVPPVPPGTVLFITIGRGANAKTFEVLIVAPGP